MNDIERLTIALSPDMSAPKADIDKGLTDLAEGRVRDFNAGRIIERGRKLLAARLPSV
jgi:antitoxin ParD1/3/4